MFRVGALSPLPRARALIQGFEARMRELGYVEGQNYTLDWTDLQGQSERYPAAMQGLVDRKVDVIIASGPEDALKAATAASKTIPIVMAAIDYDPFALGYVTSLARPTGNVTGIVLEQIELAAKRMQMVRDAFPAINKAMVFWDRQSADQWHAMRDNAAKSGFDLAGIELRDYPYDYARALTQAPMQNRGFLFTPTSPLLAHDRNGSYSSRCSAGCRRCSCSGRMSTRAGSCLTAQPDRDVPAGCRLCASHRAWSETERVADRAADDLRVGHQPTHRQGAWLGVFPSHAIARRRGD